MAENKAKKRRFPLYMTAEQDAEINQFVDNGYAKSQNDFINKAIEFYIGYLHNEKNIDYIAPILSSVIKSQMQDILKAIQRCRAPQDTDQQFSAVIAI